MIWFLDEPKKSLSTLKKLIQYQKTWTNYQLGKLKPSFLGPIQSAYNYISYDVNHGLW